MIRNQRWKLRVACAALGPTLLLAPAATAQEPPPGDLDAMLANLQKADNKAWQARGAAMQAAAKAARAEAAALRKQAGEREKAAAGEDAAAKRLVGEQQKLEQLRGIVAALSFCLLYTSPSPRDLSTSRMPSSA